MNGLKKKTKGLGKKNKRGIIITLVAMCMVGFVGAMAAFSIDAVTLYTARSEAQLAADSGALAGARVLANSGMTSASSMTVGANAISIATTVAQQVAASNPVGGRNLVVGGTCPGQEICVTINQAAANFISNPQVVVQVQRTDLPTFFARIWGRTAFTVKASATAEAYNPSNLQGTGSGPGLPIAPMCVKPWLLPNLSPTAAGGPIFNTDSGAIVDTTLLGWSPTFGGTMLYAACTNCATASGTPAAWQYYPGTTDPTGSFPAPSASSVSCTGCGGLTNYQLSIAGCVQTPISCTSSNGATKVTVDTSNYTTRNTETAAAVDDLTHSTANEGDSIDTAAPTGGPFQFVAGADDPIVQSGAVSSGSEIMVSDSLVTVPVIDTSPANWPGTYPTVQIIGFVQLFLNPRGRRVGGSDEIDTKVVNLVGCGDGTGEATGNPILGNGSSAVAVRLISQ